jgi:hypothetical protein
VATRPTALDGEIRAIYQGSFGEFVASRDALARRLRQSGDGRAAEVKALRKPPLSAWGANRLFAVEAAGMAALLAAAEKARVGGKRGVDPKVVREALRTIETETARLVGRGVEVMTDANGGAPGAAIVERLRTNLGALVFDPANAEAAARGWLDEDLPAPGFAALAGLQIASGGGGSAERREATVHRFEDGRKAAAERKERERQERRERLDKLQQALDRAERDAAAAVTEAERAAKELEAARERAERAAAAAKRARQELAQAERL